MTTIDFPHIAVIGLGYIGLPTAAALATRGVEVTGVDVNDSLVDAVNNARIPFLEPDLGAAVSGAVTQGTLKASLKVPNADVYIIAVPTPFKEHHEADLSYIDSAIDAIAPTLSTGNLVILESTSPPGTTRAMSRRLAELRPDLSFPTTTDNEPCISIAHCPERVLPGRIMIEIVTNDRVIGGLTPKCAAKARAVYEIFAQGHIVETDADSAEMSKLVENAYRDVNIAFANEIAAVCDHLRLDVWEVVELANRHPRVNILRPGPGVGGHCIAVDPWFIIAAAEDHDTRLLQTARQVNDQRPALIAEKISSRALRIVDPVIACLGLAFKADVDDLRESPAVEIVESLAHRLPEASIIVVEPKTPDMPADLLKYDNIKRGSIESAIEESDIVVLLVDHSEFKKVKRPLLEGKIVFDTRGSWR